MTFGTLCLELSIAEIRLSKDQVRKVERAIIYARVSTDDQRGNYSIPTQIEGCVRHANDKGYTIVGDRFVDPTTGLDSTADTDTRAYVDDFTSRESSRPALDAALEFLQTKGVDVVVVHALDRLARDPFTRKYLELNFQDLGARVEYVVGDYEPTPEGEVRKDIDSVFAKWENSKRVERSCRGKRGKAERGLFVGGRAPFGYTIDKTCDGGLWVDESQAKVVKRIFHLYVNEGRSIREIARLLTEEGALNHSGKKKWSKSSVGKILRNTTYAGRAFYNKNKRTADGKRLVERSREQWIPIAVTPIIDDWIFDEAERRLQVNRERRRKQPHRFYLMSGKLLCDICGRPFVAQTRKGGTKKRPNDWRAYRHRSVEGHCRNKELSADRIESAVWKKVVDLILNPDRLNEGYQGCLERQAMQQSRKKSLLEHYEQRHEKLNQKSHNLTQAYIDPDIQLTRAEYQRQRQKIADELADLHRQIEAIRQELDSIPLPVNLESFSRFTASIAMRLRNNRNLSPKAKRKVLDILGIQVHLDPNGDSFRIEGWFDDDESLSSTTC